MKTKYLLTFIQSFMNSDAKVEPFDRVKEVNLYKKVIICTKSSTMFLERSLLFRK